jgi:hypothetical protein
VTMQEKGQDRGVERGWKRRGRVIIILIPLLLILLLLLQLLLLLPPPFGDRTG